MSDGPKVHLESCSFSQKEAAKKAGARWDGHEKKWYVPVSLLHKIEVFNEWKPKGRMYLDCPFPDKDRAKKMGAKWDGECKKWFFFPSKSRKEEDFREWLPSSVSSSGTSASNNNSKEKKTPKKQKEKASTAKMKESTPAPKKVAKGAKVSHTPTASSLLPRINTDMTIGELREECRKRDPSVKGISNKNKQLLLAHLGLGTVWIAASDQNVLSTPVGKNSGSGGAQTKLPASKKNAIASTTEKNASSRSKSQTEVNAATKKRKAGGECTKKTGEQSMKKSKGESETSSIASLPRITTSMTMAQLGYEINHRNPSVKGTSNKNKQWFLDQLGLGSVWTSAPDAKGINFTTMPKVSSSMTVAQMSHEILERNPTQSGLSGKNKAWYLQHLGSGSIWITGLSSKEDSSVSSAKEVEGTTLGTKKGKTTKRSNGAAACNEVTMISALQIKIATETNRLKAKMKATTVASEASNVHSAKTSIDHDTKRNKGAQRIIGRLTSPKVLLKSAMNVKTKEISTQDKDIESACTIITDNMRVIPLVIQSMTITQLKEECKLRDPDVKGLSKMNKSHLLEFLVEGSEVEGSNEWISEKNEELLRKHVHESLCHHHLLADSRDIPGPLNTAGTRTNKKRCQTARCDIAHQSLCYREAHRSCAQCDFDICEACYEIESLPSDAKEQLLKSKYDRIREQEEKERSHRFELHKRQEKLRIIEQEEEKRRLDEELKNIPSSIKCPGPAHLDASTKLKFTVWTSCGYDADRWHSYNGPPRKEFDSSYNSLTEANQRVEYVFFYKNPWGLEKEEMNAEIDVIKSKGTRFMTSQPDDSERWKVSVLPSIAFDYINDDSDENEAVRQTFC